VNGREAIVGILSAASVTGRKLYLTCEHILLNYPNSYVKIGTDHPGHKRLDCGDKCPAKNIAIGENYEQTDVSDVVYLTISEDLQLKFAVIVRDDPKHLHDLFIQSIVPNSGVSVQANLVDAFVDQHQGRDRIGHSTTTLNHQCGSPYYNGAGHLVGIHVATDNTYNYGLQLYAADFLSGKAKT